MDLQVAGTVSSENYMVRSLWTDLSCRSIVLFVFKEFFLDYYYARATPTCNTIVPVFRWALWSIFLIQDLLLTNIINRIIESGLFWIKHTSSWPILTPHAPIGTFPSLCTIVECGGTSPYNSKGPNETIS